MYSVKAIAIFDQDGNPLLAEFYDHKLFSTQKEKADFQKNLFSKTSKSSEIVMFDDLICVFRLNVDLVFCVVGSAQENELLLLNVLNCLYDAFSIVLRKNVEKKALVDHLDVGLLIMDEICDDGVVLELDPHAIVSRCAVKPDELAFGDQSLSQLLGSAKDQFKWSLLK